MFSKKNISMYDIFFIPSSSLFQTNFHFICFKNFNTIYEFPAHCYPQIISCFANAIKTRIIFIN